MTQPPLLNLDTTAPRDLGLLTREIVLTLVSGPALLGGIGTLSDAVAGFSLTSALDSRIVAAICSDLSTDPGWSEEHWILTPDGGVIHVENSTFLATAPVGRFSKSDCLRHPAVTSWSLRGFLSAVVSQTTKDALSRALGFPLDFASAEIARYRHGHYLRRHSDTFEDRCLGLVWFFNDSWQSGDGGELIVESQSGESICITPEPGTVASILIRPGNYHQVALVRSNKWVRYSVAVHYKVSSKPKLAPT
jgi:2OG-Fe(II) oxygenase superfamily